MCALKSHPACGRFVEELADGTLRLDRARLRARSVTDPSLSAEDVALGYKQLAEVERAFRTLMHELDLRRLHHRLDARIRAHVLLCWLALLLVRVIDTETGVSWAAAREALEDLALVTLAGKDGRFQLLSTLTAEQRDLLKSLDLPPPKPPRRPLPPSEPA